MAPEPTNYSQCDMHNHHHLTNGFSQLHNSWRSFRRTVNKGIRKVVKRIGRINEQRKTTQHTSPEPDWEEVSPPVSFDRTHSRHRSSVASTQTNSLATWLSERRRLSIEQERLARRLTLAEYEDSGSWLELEATEGRARDSGTSDSDPDSPGCDEESIFQPAVYDLLTPGLISCGVATVSTDHRDSVLFTLQQLDELELDNESFVIPPPLHRTTSSPELASSPHRPYRHASPSSRSLCSP
ncbi:hypothetical protein ONZ45_g847 [Pleurotus djamor]|nr:hypothetical protein ONZ45_g847 [Pleurotus djamor]